MEGENDEVGGVKGPNDAGDATVPLTKEATLPLTNDTTVSGVEGNGKEGEGDGDDEGGIVVGTHVKVKLLIRV